MWKFGKVQLGDFDLKNWILVLFFFKRKKKEGDSITNVVMHPWNFVNQLLI